jgi:hypothetical protein
MGSPEQEISNNQQRPFIANQVQRAGHGAAGARMFHGISSPRDAERLRHRSGPFDAQDSDDSV